MTELRLDQADPAVAEIFAAGPATPEERIDMLANATRAKPQSSEALLRARIEGNDAFEGKFRIFDRDHIQNEDQNYVAVRMP